MISNYFKITWRNLIKNTQFTLLNLIGLSAGLTCVFLIFFWVKDEKKFDKLDENNNRVFRVMQNNRENSGIQTSEGAPGLLANVLVNEIPEVEDAAAVIPFVPGGGKSGIASFEDNYIRGSEQYVTKNFFNIFPFQHTGDLDDKYAVMLSDELALKLFHTTDKIIGKTIQWDRGELSGPYTVSGIFKKLPANSSVQFDLLFNYEVPLGKFKNRLENWGTSMARTYVLLKNGVDVNQVNNKIRDIVKTKFMATGGSQQDLQYIPEIFLQHYSKQYLYNKFENGVQAGGRINYVRLFSLIAIFILLIACINFMNLSTSKASRRMKEVGIKKIMGSSKTRLLLQFLTESIFMSFLSSLIAVVLTILLLPAFNNLTAKQITVGFDRNFILAVSGIALITGIVAGSYPAFYLSAIRPVSLLKGKIKTSVSEVFARKGLVVFQFTLSVVFIVAVFIVFQQMNLVQRKDIGYDRENVVQFSNEGRLKGEGLKTFLTEVKNIPGVVNASAMRYDLKAPTGFGSLDWPGKQPGVQLEFGNLEMDYDLLEVLGYKIVKGRSFSRALNNEDSKLIFNESAIAAMGLQQPIGKTISLFGQNYEIIGVVKDFHFESLHEKVKPCFFRLIPESLPINWNVVAKIKRGAEKATLTRLERFYKDYNYGLPLEYKFLAENYEELYASENRIAVLSRWFAGLAIIISCLGLFGLAAFTAQKRQKEIGIRKIAGASAGNVAFMLSRDLLRLVLIAVLLAFPIAWWATKQWLQEFSYRVNIEWWVFVSAGLIAILIALSTVGYQAIKAAIANPVKSLRTE